MELNGIKREKMLIPFIFALSKWLFINILTAGAWTGVPASEWDLFSSFVPGLCGFLNSLPQRPARSVTNKFIITWILVDVAIFTISPPSPGFLFGSGFFRDFITKSVRFSPTPFGPTPLHYFFVFWRTAFTFVIPTSPGTTCLLYLQIPLPRWNLPLVFIPSWCRKSKNRYAKNKIFLIYQLNSGANPAHSAAFFCSVLQKRLA